jgi:hypothetical protein
MGVETRPLETREDAEQLLDLVYSTYGLTYHRSFMYDADRVMELNGSGAVASFLASDSDTGRIVGHLAAIRPYFEIAAPLPSHQGPPVVEVGLSIVDPTYRQQNVQSALAIEMVQGTARRNTNLRGFYMKCLTEHTHSQKSARRFCGTATALFLGGVPSWVVCDEGERHTRQPKTTLLVHCPYGDAQPRVVHVPARHAAAMEDLYASCRLDRTLESVRGAAPPSGPTGLRQWFDPARRQGVIRVSRPGGDLGAAVAKKVEWMLRGHMEHVSVLVPLTGAGVAAAVPELEAAGLFFGGVIPDLEGVDTLVMEALGSPVIDTDSIVVLGDEAERLKEHVVDGWHRASRIRLARAG